jgi:hypothetical protein
MTKEKETMFANTNTIRTAVAALAAIGALSAAGVASGAIIHSPGAVTATPTATTTAVAAMQRSGVLTPTPVRAIGGAVALQGGSTGDGPATEQDCEDAADLANSYLSDAQTNTKNGDYGLAAADLQLAGETVDGAMDNGCFFID